VLTPEREVAELWQSAPDALTGWRRLRRFTPRIDRMTLSVDGQAYADPYEREIAFFLHDLQQLWRYPGVTIPRAHRGPGGVWKDPTSSVGAGAKFIGPVWIGAGRHITGDRTPVIGPAVLWDDPSQRPGTEAIQWLDIQPTVPPAEPAPKGTTTAERVFKRSFDFVFSFLAILFTLPLYPLIMLAIWLEDGRPFFFGHRRETRGGREFRCWKFRSMRTDAERMKAELAERNQADGPQFFIDDDPRLLRVGRLLRKYNLDELPQFLNVLLGDMSVVGPRPSPREENQFCPAWREARLSVRPGITGLWQIKRTRRRGNDFQEWIRFDIEYVERRSWRLDLYILWKTISTVMFKVSRS
jgi:lipopolysaccharide/colanic/teichoic acid biosynthesis glycosyltransferase